MRAALTASGLPAADFSGPSIWVLADTEGNEVCVHTWTGRDEQDRKITKLVGVGL